MSRPWRFDYLRHWVVVEEDMERSVKEAMVLVVANQKGGVGKTTTAINLGACLAASGKRVLLVDMDPQSNATSGLGVEPDPDRNIYNVLIGKADLRDVVVDTSVPHLFLAPAHIDLVGLEVEMAAEDDRAFLLKRALEPWLQEYDFVVIDSPPSLGLLTLNGLVAGSKVLIPLQCEYYAMEGLASLIETVKRVKLSLNPTLELWGIVFTMYDTRTKLSRQVVDEVVRHFPRQAFRTVVPRNVRLSEAPSYGIPVLLYDAKSAGAKAYLSITKEVLSRCQNGA